MCFDLDLAMTGVLLVLLVTFRLASTAVRGLVMLVGLEGWTQELRCCECGCRVTWAPKDIAPQTLEKRPSRRKVSVCAITTGSNIRKVWVTGRAMWSAIPSTAVRATETLPSLSPSIIAE